MHSRKKKTKETEWYCVVSPCATRSAMASRIVYARHMVYRICSARGLLLDQPCKLRFDEQGNTTGTPARPENHSGCNPITFDEFSLKADVDKTYSHWRAYIQATHVLPNSSFKNAVFWRFFIFLFLVPAWRFFPSNNVFNCRLRFFSHMSSLS